MKSKSYLTALIFITAGLILLLASVTSIPLEHAVPIPDGYTRLCNISLSEGHRDSMIYEFKLDQTKQRGIYVWSNSKNEKTVLLEGPNQSRIVLMEGKTRMSEVGFRMEAGEYRVLLSNEASRGDLVVFMKQ